MSLPNEYYSIPSFDEKNAPNNHDDSSILLPLTWPVAFTFKDFESESNEKTSRRIFSRIKRNAFLAYKASLMQQYVPIVGTFNSSEASNLHNREGEEWRLREQIKFANYCKQQGIVNRDIKGHEHIGGWAGFADDTTMWRDPARQSRKEEAINGSIPFIDDVFSKIKDIAVRDSNVSNVRKIYINGIEQQLSYVTKMLSILNTSLPYSFTKVLDWKPKAESNTQYAACQNFRRQGKNDYDDTEISFEDISLDEICDHGSDSLIEDPLQEGRLQRDESLFKIFQSDDISISQNLLFFNADVVDENREAKNKQLVTILWNKIETDSKQQSLSFHLERLFEQESAIIAKMMALTRENLDKFNKKEEETKEIVNNFQEFKGTEEEKQDLLRLQKQCFLATKIGALSQFSANNKTYNMWRLNGSESSTLISILLGRKNIADLMKITPQELSFLTPYIKLYKVFYPREDSPGIPYEIKFKNYLDQKSINDMINTKKGRGSGVGLQSFEFNLGNGNPVEAERMVEAKMVLSFQTMDDMLTTTDGRMITDQSLEAEQYVFKYIDLIHQDQKHKKIEETNDRVYNSKYFRIKAVVGWSFLQQGDGVEKISKESRKRLELLANKTATTFFLTMTTHDISFDETGSITLTINYMAAAELDMTSKDSDILISNEFHQLNEKRLLALNESKKEIDKQNKGNCAEGKKPTERSKEEKDKIEKEAKVIEEERIKLLNERYSSFLTEMMKKGTFRITVNPKEVFATTSNGKLAGAADQITWRRLQADSSSTFQPTLNNENLETYEANINKAIQDIAFKEDFWFWSSDLTARNEEARKEQYLKSDLYKSLESGEANNIIRFVYVGDIMEVALKRLQKGSEKTDDKIFPIFGPVEFANPVTRKKINFCLSDMPISYELFTDWFFKEVVIPQRENWYFKEFFFKFISKFLQNILGVACFGEKCSGELKYKVQSKIFEIPLNSDRTCRLTGRSIGTNPESWIFNKTEDFESSEQTWAKVSRDFWPNAEELPSLKIASYLFFYTTNLGSRRLSQEVDPAETTREERDAKWGIYHFVIGKNTGIVKNIKFSREDAPYVTSARIDDEPTSPFAIRGLYNATVELVGTSLFMPGQMIYIDPGAFTILSSGSTSVYGTPANILGIGGYYIIIKVESILNSDGKYDTTLTTKWQSYGEPARDRRVNPLTDCLEFSVEENCEEDTPTSGLPSGQVPPNAISPTPS